MGARAWYMHTRVNAVIVLAFFLNVRVPSKVSGVQKLRRSDFRMKFIIAITERATFGPDRHGIALIFRQYSRSGSVIKIANVELKLSDCTLVFAKFRSFVWKRYTKQK